MGSMALAVNDHDGLAFSHQVFYVAHHSRVGPMDEELKCMTLHTSCVLCGACFVPSVDVFADCSSY